MSVTERELFGVRETFTRILETEKYLRVLRERASSTTQILDGMPQVQSLQSKLDRFVLEIVESSHELEALHIQLLTQAVRLAQKICRLITEPQQRTLLLMRYVSCMNFRDISDELHISERTTFRIHREALEKLADSHHLQDSLALEYPPC